MPTKNYPDLEDTKQPLIEEPQVAYGLSQSTPCSYTQEELNKQLDQAEQEAYLGLGYDHDELKKMRPQWRLG